MSLWDDVKQNLSEWYTVAADKTSEIAKVQARRYDKFGLSRDVERQFSELGSLVYNGLQERRAGILDDPALLALVARIRDLEEELRRKDEDIARIRREHAERKGTAKAAAAGGGPHAAHRSAPPGSRQDDLGFGAEPSAGGPEAPEPDEHDPGFRG